MSSLYRNLPKVDEILERQEIKNLIEENSRTLVLNVIRDILDQARVMIAEGISEEGLKDFINSIESQVSKFLEDGKKHKLIKVINGTGVVLHTNLGRSALNKEIIENIEHVVNGYSNLEYDLGRGERGERYSHLEEIISEVTGAEASMVVNNNAGAVMLILSTLASGKEVVTSRGELIEIGGAFRIPDVCEMSGARLVEVGTTNKTHARDYEKAIGEETAAILKVHTSNYRVLGFTQGVPADELLKLKEENNIFIIEDLGSGVLIDLSKYGISYEPTVQESVKNGVDVISFSGDKLLGGPQAGIIVGSKEIIERLKKNPMTRALRVDKFTISALETVFRYYRDEELAVEKIPTLRMLTITKEEIKEKAEKLKARVKDRNPNLGVEIVDIQSEVGGGSLPLEVLDSFALAITSEKISDSEIETRLRCTDKPIIGRLIDGVYHLDLRTIFEEDFDLIAELMNVLE